MEKIKNIVMYCSGGLDSTCLLMYWLAKGCTIKVFSFYYGQKDTFKLKKLKENIKFLQKKGHFVSLQIINLKDVFSDSVSTLHKNNVNISKGDYTESAMKSTVIENRNLIFFSILYSKALCWANKTGENINISLSTHIENHSFYPDTLKENQLIAYHLFEISNWNSEKISYTMPFENIFKADILKKGIDAMKIMKFNKSEIYKIFKNTHSCYSVNTEGKSCKKCDICKERLQAFKICKMKDPIKYLNYF